MPVKVFTIEADGETRATKIIQEQLPKPHCDRPWAGVPVLTGRLPAILPKGTYRVKSFSNAFGHRYKNSMVIEKLLP